MTTEAIEPAEQRQDRLRNAMGLLERRVTLSTTGVLVVLAAAAWYLTVRQAHDMSGMVTGLGQVGSRMANDMTAPIFMGMWLTMMVAMMFPTIAPMVRIAPPTPGNANTQPCEASMNCMPTPCPSIANFGVVLQ